MAYRFALFTCRLDVANCKRSGDWQVIIDYYAAIFDSFSNMNFAFKVRSFVLFSFISPKQQEFID